MVDIPPSSNTSAPGESVVVIGDRTSPEAIINPPPANINPLPARRTSRSGAHKHQIIPGVRRVKGYPVTRDELLSLSGSGILGSLCFSIGGKYLDRSYDISKDLEFSQGLPDTLIVRWKTKAEDDQYIGWSFIFIGIVAFL